MSRIWSKIPNEFPAWEEVLYSALEKKVQEMRLLANVTPKSILCLSFVPVKHLEKKRVFTLTEIMDSQAPTTAINEAMLTLR